ncbi:ABC-2 type transport system ATP-binding protein [Kytococcus aerolatus]|uniref:ABC-2 type transport system ATP-binding protein n=1 Tax=Kytococcus aerolatus TaxID=592308 RepID=A0A212U7T0_9MICO|nr:ABC transporter ATP-binding protein [Kytococcus aerolatus]SNC74307.1 ABC-2 type transport system ATP-binding protein [Kytococcus aerolatus]
MATMHVDGVSRWYGDLVAVNDVTLRVQPGVTGLLGPNGAGKSTLLAMLAGFEAPSAGEVTLDGEPVRDNPGIYRRLAMMPETEAMYDELTGREFVTAMARLHRLPDVRVATDRALTLVDLHDAADRRIGKYSKGMRQRIKMAASLVHEPEVLLLDEPFNGMDPGQRVRLMGTLHEYADRGASVVVSSHILEEVQQLAGTIEVMVAGRHLASGDFRSLRRLMTDRPHQYEVVSGDDRRLAAALVAEGATESVTLARGLRPSLQVQVTDFEGFTRTLPRLARSLGVELVSVRPTDESLESVFSYLVEGR